jgi:hypothetical protein
MRARDLTKGSIAYHDTLNQDVWKGHELRIDVRYKLLEIAKRFIEYLEVPNFKLEDIILRGSLVNYNYTQYSDFDLHVVTDFSTLDCDITEAFYLAKKKIWNDEHDITIKGHEVELYVEDRAAKNVSEGTYSVLDADWLRIPKYQQPDINDRAVSAKARDLIAQINRAVKQGSIEDITRLQDKIRLMRQAGLDRGGEFSTENLAYKIIRNKKFLDKLYKTKNQRFDQELSLDENEETYSVKTDAGKEYPCGDKDHAVNKARSLLSYKKADKVYILRNGKAIYSWQLNNKMQSLDEAETDWSQQTVIPWMKFMKMLAPQLTALGFHPYRQTDGGYEFHKRPNATTDISLSINEETATEFAWQCLITVNNATQSNANPHQGVLPMTAGSIATVVDSVKKMCGTNLQESQARLDPEVEDFLDGLTPDDVGYDEVGDYIVHYEGFTDQCQDSEEYQDDPEAVFDDVWGDFKRRMGDRDPVNYGIVGEHDYPIVYSVFRR